MAKIVGFGGVFVKARDPGVLRAWYRDVLGVNLESWGGAKFEDGADDAPARQRAAVWTAFAADTEHFKPSERDVMINFRVDDLDALLAQMRTRGGTPLDRREDTPEGKFGYIVDPDGTLLELWEPPLRS